MKFRVNHTSYVMSFLDVDFDSDSISEQLNSLIKSLTRSTSFPDKLNDWTLAFCLIYNNTKNLCVARKMKSVKSMKLKDVVIHIPIPKNDQVSWGVNENQFLKELIPDRRYVEELNVEKEKYKNRTDYIIDLASRAIVYAFKNGITVNGERIKLKI